MAFRNQHLSYSRLSRFEQCPLSFKLHYIDEVPAAPSPQLSFGKAIHEVLEKLLWEHCLEGRPGPLSELRSMELWQEVSQANDMAGGGLDRFQEGAGILTAFVRRQGVIEPESILGVEQEFSFPVGPFTMVGFIDRVERLDDETVRIVDYKTNQQLFSREEVESSLQLSLYHIAAQTLWPWAKKVRLSYHMLRHGLSQDTERTDEQLEVVLQYVEALGRRIEASQEFPTRLNSFCPSCDHREQCPEFKRALQGTRTFICEDLAELESVVREREEVARLAKILTSRKDELDRVIRDHLRDREELVVGGMRYRLFTMTSHKYPLEQTAQILSRATGLAPQALQERIGAVDKKELDRVLAELAKRTGRAQVSLLKAELEASAETTHSNRLWAKETAGLSL